MSSTYTFLNLPGYINEGDAYTIDIITTEVSAGTQLWWTLDNNATDYGTASSPGDFAAAYGSFTIDSEGRGSFGISIRADQLTEGGESFRIQLRSVNQYGDVLELSTPINIVDTSNVIPIYTFGSVPVAINEGSAGTFTVNTVHVANGTTLFWTANYGGSSSSADLSAYGSFVINSNAGSFTVTPTADLITEGAETFSVSIRTVGTGGTVVLTSNPVTINDTSLSPVDYAFVSIPAAINEGTTGTFNVSTTNVVNGTTLYWTIDYNSSSSVADFLFPQSGSFIINSNAGSFGISPKGDYVTEGAETFRVQVRTNSINGSVVATSSPVTINDTYTGYILPSSTFTFGATPFSANEGDLLTFTVTTTSVQDTARVYWTIDFNNSSGFLDFSSVNGFFTVYSNFGSFSIALTQDLLVEGSESFRVRLRLGSTTGPVLATSPLIIINDTSDNNIYSVIPQVGNSLLARDYNTLNSFLKVFMGTTATGYGATLVSSTVSTGTRISHTEWNDLHSDLLRCSIHQLGTGATIPGEPALVYTGDLITATNVNIYASSLQRLYNNRGLVNTATQISTTIDNGVSVRDIGSPWIAEIEHDITYTWPDEDHAKYFFNLGGSIEHRLGYVPGEISDNYVGGLFANLINNFNSRSFKCVGNNFSAVIQVGQQFLTMDYTRSNAQVNSRVSFNNISYANSITNMTLISTSTVYYSNDLTGGIAAPIPHAVPTHVLSQEGYYALITSAAVPLMTFDGGSYLSRSVRIINIGTIAATVTNILLSADVVDGLYSNVEATYPFTIAPNSGYRDVVLTYGGSPSANIVHYGSMTVKSNNEYGDYIIPTSFKAIFSAVLSPASYSGTVTINTPITIPFTVNTIGGAFARCTITTPGSSGFSVPASSSGPTFNITFDPNLQTNGVHTISFTVLVYSTAGATATVGGTASVTRLIVDQHLGNWISPLGYNNSVVGFSYDIVGGRRCLSFGVGMGNWPVGNGASELNGGGQLQVATALKSLEPNVATNPSPAVVWPYQNPSYGTFLRTYGAWANPGGSPDGPYTWDTQGNPYTFDAPHTSGSATYYYEFSADNSGYFYVDGTEISISGDLTSSVTGSISLTPGRHTIAWLIDNIGGPGALGLRIYSSNGTDIWSTLTPIGSVPYWLDYGRIFLDGANRAYYSKDSYIRNLGLSGNFGVGSSNGSMFTVTDDGYGNLNIALSTLRQYTGNGGDNTTLGTLTESFYYYSANTDHPRFNNLESPINDTQTHYFTGFTNPGEVTTSIVPFPVPPPPPPPPPPPDSGRSGGRGGEGPGNYGALTDGCGGRILGRCGAWNAPPASDNNNYSNEGRAGTNNGGQPAGPNSAGPNSGSFGSGFGCHGGGGYGGGGGDGGPGPTCFVEGVLVTLSTGIQIPIEDVKIGDFVLGLNGINKVAGHDRPMLIIDNIREGNLYGFNGLDKFVTSEHPIMTKQGWKAIDQDSAKKFEPQLSKILIGDLSIGDEILCQDGSYMTITSIEKYEEQPQQRLYNLLLDGDHTYYVNGLLVHNKD